MKALKITKILGGEKVLGGKVQSASDLIPMVRNGLSFESLEAVITGLDLSREQVLSALALSPRTIARRKEESRLTPVESDRVYRLARIAARAEEVFGDLVKARTWMVRPNRALGNVLPLNLLDTDEGTRQVEAVLGRIEHGVWS